MKFLEETVQVPEKHQYITVTREEHDELLRAYNSVWKMDAREVRSIIIYTEKDGNANFKVKIR